MYFICQLFYPQFIYFPLFMFDLIVCSHSEHSPKICAIDFIHCQSFWIFVEFKITNTIKLASCKMTKRNSNVQLLTRMKFVTHTKQMIYHKFNKWNGCETEISQRILTYSGFFHIARKSWSMFVGFWGFCIQLWFIAIRTCNTTTCCHKYLVRATSVWM